MVSQSDPTWAVEQVQPSHVPALPSTTDPPGASSTVPSTTTAAPDGRGLNPIANVLVEEIRGVWKQVDVGRPLVNCRTVPIQVTIDLARFISQCGG
jgi:hypothetical protein